MDFIFEGFRESLRVIAGRDPEVIAITWLTLRVACFSAAIAAVLGVPLGFVVAVSRFRGRGVALAAMNAAMSLPTVTVGLVVYAFISRRGPLGALGLLFTPAAMVVGQVILATPIIAALTCSAVRGIDAAVRKTAATLGAGPLRAAFEEIREARYTIMAAVTAGFGRVVTEVGAAAMLGGNIRGATRTLTTAIAFETGKGEFAFSFALGIILLAMAFMVTGLFHLFQRRAE